jgi:hypothetical protein
MSGDGRHRLDTRAVGPKKNARLALNVRAEGWGKNNGGEAAK